MTLTICPPPRRRRRGIARRIPKITPSTFTSITFAAATSLAPANGPTPTGRSGSVCAPHGPGSGSIMIEREDQTGGEELQPDEVPTDEQLDVEGPNESTQPSGAPLGEDEEEEGDDAAA